MKKLLKFKRVDTDFSSCQRGWENFEQGNNSTVLNVLFVSHNSEEKSMHTNRVIINLKIK